MIITSLPDMLDDYDSTNSDRVIAECELQGLVCDFPGDSELQVDLDTEADWDRFQRAWEVLARELELEPLGYKVTPSRRKEHGKHVRIELPCTVTPLERIALQACLGSDGVRELLSFRRLQAGDPHPTLFVERVGFDA